MKTILEKAKKLVIPSSKCQAVKAEIAKQVLHLVTNKVSKFPQIKEVEFGGSYSKGTWLPEKADLDIFIKFDKKTTPKEFTKISQKVGFSALKKFNPYTRYSEHPYVEAMVKDTRINVVPCYIVEKGKWQSAADRTPYHTRFMLASLTDSMKDDVRLLKRFLKINGIYGAEISKNGFSGYVAEVLVWYYGSFEKVINAFATIKSGTVLGKTSKEFDTPITIIDPIDPQRNLSAAISIESLGKFILLCREFKKKPSIKFFKNPKKRFESKILENCIVIKFKHKQRSPDIIWGQIKKASNALAKQFGQAGFVIIKNDAMTDEIKESYLLFLFESLKISNFHAREGPEFFNDNDSYRFLTKNGKKSKFFWISEDKKINCLLKRSHNDAKKFLDYLLSKNIENSGIPKGIRSDLLKEYKIFDGRKKLTKSIKLLIKDVFSTNETIFPSN